MKLFLECIVYTMFHEPYLAITFGIGAIAWGQWILVYGKKVDTNNQTEKKGNTMRVPDYIGGYTDFLDQMRYMRMGEREQLMFRILWLLKLHRSKLRMRQLGITIDDKPKYYGANTDSKHGISR